MKGLLEKTLVNVFHWKYENRSTKAYKERNT